MNDFIPESIPTHGVDVALLRKTLEYITEHPERHRQDVWAIRNSCGTAMCLAGWVVTMAALDIDFDEDYDYGGGTSVLADGRQIPDVAADLIGVERPDDVDADKWHRHLFYENNTLANLWRKAAELTDGEIEVPTQFQRGTRSRDGAA